MTKEKAIIEMILTWLDANMDEPPPEGIQEDSANLKEKIILALSDEATIEDIQTEIYKDRNTPQGVSVA
jgi:hypothetical protein